jgi:hypothetical protein
MALQILVSEILRGREGGRKGGRGRDLFKQITLISLI